MTTMTAALVTLILSTAAATGLQAAAAPPAKTWTCSAPRPLETDSHQTVKVCEWR